MPPSPTHWLRRWATAQKLVARVVAQRVVHGLEMVQVDKQYGGTALALPGAGNDCVEPVHEVAPVGQFGERVVQGQEGFALLRLFARRDVAQDDDAVVPVQLGHGLAHGLHRDDPPILVTEGHLIRVFPPPAGVLQRHGPPLGADEMEDRQAQDFMQCIACQARQGFVAVGDEAVAVEDDGFVRGIGKLAHALFGLPHQLVGAPALHDVDDQRKRTHRFGGAAHVGDELHLDHAGFAVGQGLLAGVFDALATLAALHIRGDGLPGPQANGFLHGAVQHGVGRLAVVGGISLVGKAAQQAGQLEIGHQGRYRIGDQAQQRVAGAGLGGGGVFGGKSGHGQLRW